MLSGVSVRGLCVSVRELCVSVRGVVKVSVSLRRGVSISVCERVVSEEDCVCDVGFMCAFIAAGAQLPIPYCVHSLRLFVTEDLLNNNV